MAIIDRSPTRLSTWLARHPELVTLLRRAAAGERELSHGELDAVATTRAVEYFRQQLVQAGLLPERHHQLGLFDRWLAQFIAAIDPPSRRQHVATYATWHHRRRLVTAIEHGTLRPASTRAARRHIRVALRFLEWLDAERQRSLAECSQTDLDDWFATGNTNRLSAIAFITSARIQQLCRANLRVPVYRPATPNGMPFHERVELVSRLLYDDTIPTGDRVAGLLVALYAQPVTRISRLRVAAVSITPRRASIRFGDEHLDLAAPVARLAGQHVAEVAQTSRWLFAGRTPGQPCSSHGLAERLRRHGVSRAARIGALHDLVQQIPSPVLAKLIDYNPVVVANRAVALAAPWEHYASLRSENCDSCGLSEGSVR